MASSLPNSIETRLFINNEYVAAKSKETLTLVNPFDDSVIPAEVHVAGEEDVNDAVEAARAAFKTGPWSTYTGAQRAVHMHKFADLIEKNAVELATLDTISMGAPIAVLAGFIIPHVVAVFRYYAGWADKIQGESFGAEDGEYKIVRKEPLGVCAGIAPWNVPILYVAWKIAPALAAGNTYIFKSSEKSPLSALAIGKLVVEAGFPPGVLQFISGGPSTGSLLASHMDIAKISFTGSTAVGKIIQNLATNSNMKRVTLELGGKSPAVVFADADFENAVGSAADGFLVNSGQVCVAPSRLYIQDTIAPAFIEAVKSRFQALASTLGSDPRSMTTSHGPMADKKQFDRVMSYINIGKRDGDPVVGGARKGDKGYFIEPTIFLDPDHNNPIYKEEIFGPVLNIVTFKTEEEAIALANDTNTGLSGNYFPLLSGLLHSLSYAMSAAAIYTNDLNRALRVSAQIESGTVSINKPHFPNVQVPFGGFKQSGSGQELGVYGLESFLQTKTVIIKYV
ncbi:putative aldehyde dehydrogenase-1 [Coleophoma crateriformis]|uniref:aldehyde dehydrogenase (NAD(+)) n=1 Tax=Coleophoma crateriformis TaxID=565419 RepID=A0A3D8QZH8_9HELO|nr:putative aldehyde dehydrogenase-1 [Coleophoma crateriformis]